MFTPVQENNHPSKHGSPSSSFLGLTGDISVVFVLLKAVTVWLNFGPIRLLLSLSLSLVLCHGWRCCHRLSVTSNNREYDLKTHHCGFDPNKYMRKHPAIHLALTVWAFIISSDKHVIILRPKISKI